MTDLEIANYTNLFGTIGQINCGNGMTQSLSELINVKCGANIKLHQSLLDCFVSIPAFFETD